MGTSLCIVCSRQGAVASPTAPTVSGWKEMFYLTTHSTHFIYGYMASDMVKERERDVLFNDALNTFHLRLYGIRHVVKERERDIYLTMHSTHFIYGYTASRHGKGERERCFI